MNSVTPTQGWHRLDQHAILELAGGDRHSFLHSFCTADIKSLPFNQATEAFILNEKGKVLALVHVLAEDERLRLLFFDGEQRASQVLAHLDKYLIREDVEMRLVEDTQLWWIDGAGSPFSESLERNRLTALDTPFIATRACLEMAGWGELLLVNDGHAEQVREWLQASGLPELSLEALHRNRISQQTPWNQLDVDDQRLPQELERDDKAISFEKGCYLGQETVARIDALGRVNWLLRLLAWDPGSSIVDQVETEGKKVADVMSRTSDAAGQPRLSLAYVRRGSHTAGTRLGSAEVLAPSVSD